MSDTPPGFVHGVIVSPRVAQILGPHLAELRNARSNDPEVDATLAALHWAGQAWVKKITRPDSSPCSTPAALTPNQVAVKLKVTPTRVRQLIRDSQLLAERHEGRWQITPAALDAYREAKGSGGR